MFLKGKLRHRIVLSSLIALSVIPATFCGTGASAHSDVFSNYSLNRAKQIAQQDQKLLLVEFTASWCPPCKEMEASTWTDEAVRSWIKENALAIQIDVDEDEKTSAALKVEAMPTLVLYTPASGSREFGRQVGLISASELLRWLEGAKSGKSAEDLEKELAGSNTSAIWERMSKARELDSAGKSAEAFEEYVWLWGNLKDEDPNLGPIRSSMLPVEMKKLAAVNSSAKGRLLEMRDAAEKADNRHDWIILNGMLDDNARTLAWFDKAKSDSRQLSVFRKHTALLEPVLFSASRWSDAATYLYPEPLARINEYYKRAQDMKKPRPHTEMARDFDPFPGMVLLLYGAYIGAGREVEAQKIADECLRLDDTAGMREALGGMAKGMRQARDLQKKGAK